MLFALSCDDCEKWMHTDGEITRRAGLPVARPKGVVTPCHKCAKLLHTSDKRRGNAQEPTERSRRALRHYRECKAVGRFPDDAIVRRDAGVILETEDALRDAKADLLAELGASLLRRLTTEG